MYSIRADKRYTKDRQYKYLCKGPIKNYSRWSSLFHEDVWAMSKEQVESTLVELKRQNHINPTIVPYKTALLDILTDIY